MNYQISPLNKKCLFETHFYSKTIREVEYKFTKTLVWRWGSFQVELTEDELKRLKNCEEGQLIKLNDYTYEFEESIDCCIYDYEAIQPKNIDIEELLQEEDEDGDIPWDLEENGWLLDEVEYEIVGPIECKPV